MKLAGLFLLVALGCGGQWGAVLEEFDVVDWKTVSELLDDDQAEEEESPDEPGEEDSDD